MEYMKQLVVYGHGVGTVGGQYTGWSFIVRKLLIVIAVCVDDRRECWIQVD